MKKYELTNEVKGVHGIRVYRIKALESFSNVNKGDLGGYVESEVEFVDCELIVTLR